MAAMRCRVAALKGCAAGAMGPPSCQLFTRWRATGVRHVPSRATHSPHSCELSVSPGASIPSLQLFVDRLRWCTYLVFTELLMLGQCMPGGC